MESILFQQVARASAAVAATRSRKGKILTLTETFRATPPQELDTVTTWLAGDLPQGRIGLGPSLLREVASTPAAPRPTLTVADLDGVVDRLAAISGKGAVARRRTLLTALLQRLTAEEQAFLVRLLLGDLRQGALEGVIIEAIAAAVEIDAAQVRRAVMVSGNLAAVAVATLSYGRDGLARFRVQVGTPLQPMLAQTADNVADAVAALGRAAFDYKLDGARVQIHRDGDAISIFTRQLNDVTERLPEIVELVRMLPERKIILDGEVIALRDDGSAHPFQVTMRRFGRQLDIAAMRDQVPLSVFFFDLLYCDEDLTTRLASERFALMNELLPPALLVPRLITSDPQAAQQLLAEALAAGHEGVMAKAIDTAYEAGSRGAGWLKIKPAHTLDLVVLAAEWGSGRRKGKLSNLHLGAYDPDSGEFVMLGKTFKGLTDAMLEWQTERLLELQTHRKDHVVYVRPALVVEIAFNELQRSRQYPGGLALRFARVKAHRDDKDVTQVDSIDTVRSIYERGFRAG